MPRRKNVHPAYLHHAPTNQAYIRIPNGKGGRKTVYLGEYESTESKAEYRGWLAELDAATSPATVIQANNDTSRNSPRDVLVSEVYREFWKHAVQHYRREDGSHTDQLREFRQTFRIVLDLYGGTPAKEFGPLALKAVRQQMIASDVTRPLIEKFRHELTVTLPDQPVRVEGDPVRLTQIFANLLNNATKYTDPGGRISLTATVKPSERTGTTAFVEIRLRDTGMGISSELLPSVFDLFTQANRSLDRSQGGLGIGLTLVRKLVEMHGGTAEAHSEGIGHGSEFVVRLPSRPTVRLTRKLLVR